MAGLEDEALAGVTRVGRMLALVVLAWLSWGFVRAGVNASVMDSFLHLPDLVFHEAGHVIFSPLGRFMTVLGGSLFQCLVPLILAIAFLRQRDGFGAAVCAWWFGQNLVDVAPYIADARSLRLTLIGGRTGAEVEGHDWEFLLTQLNWIHLDRAIGLWVFRLGIVIMIAALVYAAVLVARAQPRASEL